MRSLLATLLSWLMPAQGKRRAAPQAVPTEHIPADSPTQRLIITHNVVGVERPRDYLRGEDTPLIRPYLIAWEREQERQRLHRLQRDRRRAAVLATLGQDYPTLSLDIHGVTA